MDIQSWAFLGGFLGAAIGIPAGFVFVEVIKFLVSIRDRRHPHAEIMEWATAQPGVKILYEQQVANNWIRTYDTGGSIDPPANIDDLEPIKLPFRFVTVAIGGAQYQAPLMTDIPAEAETNQAHLVNQTRRKLRLIPN